MGIDHKIDNIKVKKNLLFAALEETLGYLSYSCLQYWSEKAVKGKRWKMQSQKKKKLQDE